MKPSITKLILLFVLVVLLLVSYIHCAKTERFDDNDYTLRDRYVRKQYKKFKRMLKQIKITPKQKHYLNSIFKDVVEPKSKKKALLMDTDDLMDLADAKDPQDERQQSSQQSDDDEEEDDTRKLSLVGINTSKDSSMKDSNKSKKELPSSKNEPISTVVGAPATVGVPRSSYWHSSNWYYTTTILFTCVVSAVLLILLLVVSWLFCCYNQRSSSSTSTYLPTTTSKQQSDIDPYVGEYKSPAVVVTGSATSQHPQAYVFKH